MSHHIETGDAPPILQNSYCMGQVEKAHVQNAIDEMLKADIISPSTSSWEDPIVLVNELDDSLWFYVDFCQLNEITMGDANPLPQIDNSLDALAGAKYFSTLDLSSRFGSYCWMRIQNTKLPLRHSRGYFILTVFQWDYKWPQPHTNGSWSWY